MTPENFQIQTPRLYLRRWTDADAADAFSLWGSAVVMHWVDTPDASEEVSLRSLRRGDEVFLTRVVCGVDTNGPIDWLLWVSCR